MIRLYDSARQAVVPLELRDPGKVSMYVCGPTVYGPPHIGHGRMALVFDLYRRFLEWNGLDVTFVSNVTDIDDSIIDRANAEGRDWSDIATSCEEVWWQGMDLINVRRPDHTPHATEYVAEMVALVGRLIEADKAYITSDGVYLSVEAVEGYGLLAHQSLDDLLEGGGERVVFTEEKRHPADFALWKLAKPGEPKWDAPWGAGRPGWHTECVVMSLDILGEGFDLHTGGMDLMFPHHENERAQAVAEGRQFAKHWMHNGFVEFGGEKMSKSLGNVMNLLDIASEYDPRAYRLVVMQAHYRSPIEVTDVTLRNAEAALERLDSFARRTADLSGQPSSDVLAQVKGLLENDFDLPGATDLLFRQVREANTLLDAADVDGGSIAAATARELTAVFGLVLNDTAGEVPAAIQALVVERGEARAAKDFARADAIRDTLAEQGWRIEDGPDGAQALPL